MVTPDLTPARLEQLLAAATPGPWHVDGLHTSAVIVRMSEHAWRRVAETDTALFHNPNWRADTTLIALSPALAARVIELEAENARLMALLRKIIAASNSDNSAHLHGQIAKARAALETAHD